MLAFTPIEFQHRHHEDRVAALRTSMNRPPLTPRRTLGSLLVSLGTRLAGDDRSCPQRTRRAHA